MRLFEVDNKDTPDLIAMLKVTLPIIMKELELTSLPTIHLVKHVGDAKQPTFGKYENNTHTIYVGIENRQPMDVIRTLAHELCHYKQDLTTKLDHTSGNTGSPEENEAHAIAGVIMRNLDKKFPDFLLAPSIKLP